MNKISKLLAALALAATLTVVPATHQSAEAHSTKDCRAYSTSTSLWRSTYQGNTLRGATVYVFHWHLPRGLNFWGSAHFNVSGCTVNEFNRANW